MRRLGDLMAGRHNNFNLLRMIAASAVLISHAWPIALGRHAIEPLEPMLHISLGTLAVLTFFAISGFFISQSFDRRTSIVGFATARVLRIYPGLLIVLLITILLVGPIFTTLPLGTYFSDVNTPLYLTRNLTLKWMQYDLPGVFPGNPYPSAINGSLFTLFYEVVCYGLVVLIGISGVTALHWRFVGFLGAYLIIYTWMKSITISNPMVANFHLFVLPFVIGMAAYQFRRHMPLNPICAALLGVAAWMAYDKLWFPEVFVLAWSYFIFYLGFLPYRPLTVYNRLGDYSYGMYIYAFPCEQICAALWKGISPVGLIAVSFLITLCCAALSWHLIEHRALSRRTTVANWLERKFAPFGWRGEYPK